MQAAQLNQGLLEFLQASPTPFHAVSQMVAALEAKGFERLTEQQSWQHLREGTGQDKAHGKAEGAAGITGKYYLVRDDSSIIAMQLAQRDLSDSGLRMIGAHTDSPCLKLKPQPDITSTGYSQWGVQVYGGALLNPWFDRDLSLAGRVNYLDEGDNIASALINFERPVAVVPSLAIHLDREANKNRSVNPQTDMPPVIALSGVPLDSKADSPPDSSGKHSIHTILQSQLEQQQTSPKVKQILDFDLFCYDTQPPALIGYEEEFIASARLDNLLSCYIGLQALLNCDPDSSALLICSDHEEVGSASTAGAEGTFLKSVLERLVDSPEQLSRMISRSMMLSVDNAHGIHPNYADKHDEQHGPLLNAGPVLKMNASQRYASNGNTAAVLRQLCEVHQIPLQSFVVRSDMGCGSTIGPIVATGLGVPTLDLGVATFAMHSIRELAGSEDPQHLWRALTEFCNLPTLPWKSCI